MPASPQEVLSDPRFHAMGIEDRLRVMQTVDPKFAAFEPGTQREILYKAASPGPPLPKAPTPAGVRPEEETFFNLPGRGVNQAIGGIERMAQPGKEAKYEGASDIIRGGLKALIPFGVAATIPAAMAAPAATAGAIARAMVGGKVGSTAAKLGTELAGGSAGAQELAEDIGGIGGAGAAQLPSQKTLGTILEYLKPQGKRWAAAKARYEATHPDTIPYTGPTIIPGTAGPAGTVNRQRPTTGTPATGTVNLPPPEPQVIPGTAGPSGVIPGPIPSGAVPSVTPVISSSGTISGTIGSPVEAYPRTETSTLDELAYALTRGKVNSFVKASAGDQAKIIAAHNAIKTTAQKGMPAPAPSGQPTPAPVKSTPVAASPLATEPLPALVPVFKPLGDVSATERETNLLNMMRGNTTRKNLEIGSYFLNHPKQFTPEQVAAMPKAEFNAHIPNVKNASGDPYKPSTGRNYHRTFEQARQEVVDAMREMMGSSGLTPPRTSPE